MDLAAKEKKKRNDALKAYDRQFIVIRLAVIVALIVFLIVMAVIKTVFR
jgi:subtilase family serine protease